MLAPAATLVVWILIDLLRGRQATAIGAATAVVVGCVAITPAGGYVSPGWALAIGAVATFPCYFAILWRPRTRVDETLDVLSAHGVAGLTGTLLIGFVAQATWNDGAGNGLFYGDAGQLWSQVVAVLAGPAYAFGMTWLLIKGLGLLMPLRGPEQEEALGMDLTHHGEEAYASGEGAILIGVGSRVGRSPRV